MGLMMKSELASQKDIEEVKRDIERLRLELPKEIKDSQLKTVLWVACLLVANSAMIVSLLKLL